LAFGLESVNVRGRRWGVYGRDFHFCHYIGYIGMYGMDLINLNFQIPILDS
jgi:hypothetical protein